MRHDPIALYRFALRCGDDPLIDALTRAFRPNRELARRADLELQALPRMRTPSGAARRAAAALARTIALGAQPI